MASRSSRSSTEARSSPKAAASTTSSIAQTTPLSSIPQSSTISTIPQPTTLSTSVSRSGPADALTTPYEPPAKCSQELSRFANTACMPPNWNAYWYGNVGYYSPAVCPQSYAIVAPRPSNIPASAGFGPAPFKDEVAMICCPSGYVTVSNSASFCSSASSSAYAIQVRWQYSDIPNLQGITEMIKQISAMPTGGYSTITASSSPTSAAAPSSGSAGLSTGSKVAIGIFVPLVIISAFAGALMFFLKRRRSQGTSASPKLDKAMFHSHSSSDTSVTLELSRSATVTDTTDNVNTSKSDDPEPQVSEKSAVASRKSGSRKNPKPHTTPASILKTMPKEEAAEAHALSCNGPLNSHKPQVSLTIPPEVYIPDPRLQEQQHGDTPLLPRAPSPAQFLPQVALSRSMSSPVQDYGYSRMQHLSQEDLSIAGPAYVAPLPPPTSDRPEPLRIRQSVTSLHPALRPLKRASSAPVPEPIPEIVTHIRYIAPSTTAMGESAPWPIVNDLPSSDEKSRLTAASFALSPGAPETPLPEYSALQMPLAIAELEARSLVELEAEIPESLYMKPAQTIRSGHSSPRRVPGSPPRSRPGLISSIAAPSSPPRSKSAMERPLRLNTESLEPPPRCRSALDQSPVDRASSHSDDVPVPYRPTTPQTLPQVFSQKRSATAVMPKMNMGTLPRLQPVPDYAGADYGDDSGSAVDVQDEEMFRRVQERMMLEERERRLERAVDARDSWRGAHVRHRPMSRSFG